ncbi:hypothetical protein CTAYLR_006930 [Chrysophaeum taylorii]|uniref:NADP-dependent oxidoreductase domain-containing protein n=1 Tax=Chrysophaeum taylorii TaxID=2483200 RepID=A0AAD7U9E9_9STRA|nr:hypothetical protein CTAYLR_006930 [Chrysophaeum taylorii]
MPMVGLGTWKSPPGVTCAAVRAGLEAGYRLIDAANDYNNEVEVGEALCDVPRSELFVQAKLWNTNHRPEHVRVDIEQTLKDLKLDYLDSYVIHWAQAAPSAGRASTRINGAYPAPAAANSMFPLDEDGYFCSDNESHFVDTWKAMEDLVDEGLAKTIGLSNFNKAQVSEILGICRHPVSVLQCECHPYLQQKDLIDFCRTRGIVFQAFSPLGSGDTNLAVEMSPSGTIPLRDPLVLKLAEKYEKDAAQIILRWQLQRGIAFVSKSANPARVRSNFDIFDWELEPDDMRAFDAINYGWRHLLWREVSHHPDYPFKDELPRDYELEKAPVASSSGTTNNNNNK